MRPNILVQKCSGIALVSKMRKIKQAAKKTIPTQVPFCGSLANLRKQIHNLKGKKNSMVNNNFLFDLYIAWFYRKEQ